MKPIKIVIVDDEQKATSNLSLLLNKYCEEVSVTGIAHTIKAAVSLINETNPDMVFLDVELQQGTGFDLLDHFPGINFQIVFVTAYQEYALQAIKAGALDYILKPIHPEELQNVVERLRQRILYAAELQPGQTGKANSGKLVLHSLNGFHIVAIKDILYCKAERNYLHVMCRDGKDLLVTKHMKKYETLLTNNDFFRIHHSYLVNLHAVKQFISKDGSMVVLENGEKLPVSTRKKEAFIRRVELME